MKIVPYQYNIYLFNISLLVEVVDTAKSFRNVIGKLKNEIHYKTHEEQEKYLASHDLAINAAASLLKRQREVAIYRSLFQ